MDERNMAREIWKGIGLTALLHLLWILFPVAYFAIGIAQLIYMVPAIVIAFKKGRRQFGQGLVIGAAITFLVNTACFGLVTTGVWYPF